MRDLISRGGNLASASSSLISVGQVFEISFATFTPRITIRSVNELSVEIIAGTGRFLRYGQV